MMRADRLLAILLLLQARGRMTAAELADELEVSERTIYRDLDALSTAGVPVYTGRGPGGGCGLDEDYRTSLTGLTEGEARAVLLVSIPEPLAALGLSEDLKAGLRKVFAALPAGKTERKRLPVYLDWSGSSTGQAGGPHLRRLYEAACAGRLVQITYRMINGVAIERVVAPYGLVAKAGRWYLAAWGNGKMDIHAVDSLLDAAVMDGQFERPADFSLEKTWQEHSMEAEASAASFVVKVRAEQAVAERLAREHGSGAWTGAGETLEVVARFDSFWSARAAILGYGRAVEVLEPEALRRSVADFGEQIAMLYREG